MIGWNWEPDPANVAFVDVETQSTEDIRAVGGRRYARHASTRLAVVTCLIDDWLGVWYPQHAVPHDTDVGVLHGVPDGFTGECCTYVSPRVPDEMLRRMAGRVLVGHNSYGFDSIVWERCVGDGFTWYDTLPAARASSLPGGINALGERLIGVGKDQHGSQLIRLLSIAKVRGGDPVYPVGTALAWRMFGLYCARDTLLTKIVFHETLGAVEPGMMRMHVAMNARGIPIDADFATSLLTSMLEHEVRARDKFKGLSDDEVDNPNSVQQVRAWLRTQGLDLPSLERKELETFLQDPASFMNDETTDEGIAKVVEALRTRQSFARAGKGKVKTALLGMDPDRRMRDVITPYGAHTGRFTAQGLQIHNFPRGSDKVRPWLVRPPTLEAVDAEAVRAEVDAGDVMGTLLRSIIGGTRISWADYNAIEARGAGWFAGDRKLMTLFGDPSIDPYLDLAEVIYGYRPGKKDRERWVAKQGMLGAMYQLSGAGLEARVAQEGLSLQAAGTSGKAVIGAYRRTFHMVPTMWKEYHDAAHRAVKERRETFTCRCLFRMVRKVLQIVLPSGRILRYHDARIEDRVPGWAKYNTSGPTPMLPTVVFALPRGYDGFLYGGRITENVVQAGMRDVLVDALIRCDDEGLSPIFHVHDEGACGTDALEEMCIIMSTPPKWAPDFPILVEGACNDYWAKEPPPEARRCRAFNGRVL